MCIIWFLCAWWGKKLLFLLDGGIAEMWQGVYLLCPHPPSAECWWFFTISAGAGAKTHWGPAGLPTRLAPVLHHMASVVEPRRHKGSMPDAIAGGGGILTPSPSPSQSPPISSAAAAACQEGVLIAYDESH